MITISVYLLNPITALVAVSLLAVVWFQIRTVRKPKEWKWWLLHILEATAAVGFFLLRYNLTKAGNYVGANISLAGCILFSVFLFVTMELNTRHDEKKK